jgi:hypothetical protein
MRSVPAGTSGVRTVAWVQLPCISRVLRSVQYCQPAVASCRNTVTFASGVVVLYQSDRSYCLPAVTTGAQTVDSVISALRSPSTRRVSDTFIALEPLWASVVVSNVKSLSPQPDFSQQYGIPSVPAVSKPGFLTRLAASADWGEVRSRPAVRAPTPTNAVLLRCLFTRLS